jgi:hypothetical protein
MHWDQCILINFEEPDETKVLSGSRPVRTTYEYKTVQQLKLLDDFVWRWFETLDAPSHAKAL